MRVEIREIAKKFGDQPVLDGVSLAIPSGGSVALLGPSGCGKTTLLRIVAGLETPDRGEIRLDEQDATAWAPRDRSLAMVFQDSALYPGKKVARNIGFPLEVAGVSRADQRVRVREISEWFGVSHLLDRYPDNLSGGEAQRVALCRALVRDVPLVLFDEPLSNIDSFRRNSLRPLIRGILNRSGSTSIYVTHDQADANLMADSIAVVRAGRIEQFGTMEDLRARPASAFVARFIGDPPMNVWPARVSRANGGWMLSTLGRTVKINDDQVSRLGASESDDVLIGAPSSRVVAGLAGKDTLSIDVTADRVTFVDPGFRVDCSTPSGDRISAASDARPVRSSIRIGIHVKDLIRIPRE